MPNTCEFTENSTIYFLTVDGQPERQVTKAEFVAAERAAGYPSKFGHEELSTTGFTSELTKTSGRIQTVSNFRI